MGTPNSPFYKGDKDAEPDGRDAEVEAALDAAEAADTKVVDAVADKAEAEETVNELFDKTEENAEEDVADEGDTDEALFDEPSKAP